MNMWERHEWVTLLPEQHKKMYKGSMGLEEKELQISKEHYEGLK